MSDADHPGRSSTAPSTRRRTPRPRSSAPGGTRTCSSRAPTPCGANVGFYTSVAGLGQNPDDVTINGDVTVDAFNASDAGNATQNFWRSAENLAINPTSGTDRWAVAQAAPFRRIDVHGGLQLYPASYGYASGGYIADTKVNGQTASVLAAAVVHPGQQPRQLERRRLEHGVLRRDRRPGERPSRSPPETTLATTPVSRDVPYLYLDGTGKYRVFLPSLRTNASGAELGRAAARPGTSLPMSQFYVVKAGDTAATINTALAQGCNLFFTPGVYHLNQTLNVTKANTVVLGIGYPTLIPDNGVNAMQVADVDGVRIKGLLFDAGTTNSAALLTVGPAGSTRQPRRPTRPRSRTSSSASAATIAGKATNSLVVNSNNTIIDHIWAWRADHGNAGTVGWTVNTADTGLIVNGDNVLATGLFVEHYQKYEVVWNGQGGKTIFFQNEMPYDPPNQAAWMNGSTSTATPPTRSAPASPPTRPGGWAATATSTSTPRSAAYHAFEVPARRREVPRRGRRLPRRRRHHHPRHQRHRRGGEPDHQQRIPAQLPVTDDASPVHGHPRVTRGVGRRGVPSGSRRDAA